MFKGNRILVRHNKSSSYPGFELSGVYFTYAVVFSVSALQES